MKFFGIPLFLLCAFNVIYAKEVCYCQEVCSLWGDPHIKTFNGTKPGIKITDKDNFIILKVKKFVCEAIIDKRGYMREITWGGSNCYLEDCRGKETVLPEMQYTVGNVELTGTCSCKFKKDSKKFLHLDLTIKKKINGNTANVNIEGACVE